jgi:hypothetical protein
MDKYVPYFFVFEAEHFSANNTHIQTSKEVT